MDTISMAAAAVTGARHLRGARNGQDAAATWRGIIRREVAARCREAGSREGVDTSHAAVGTSHAAMGTSHAAVVVVADGCGSGASSEVGARLGATLFARAVGARLERGQSVRERSMWDGARADVVASLAELVERTPGDRFELIHDSLLFTLVAAAVTSEGAAVWALGDGVYSLRSREVAPRESTPCENDRAAAVVTRVLGPFADNAPPYLAYDLLGDAREAVLEVVPQGVDAIVIATDGACDLLDRGDRLDRFAGAAYARVPDKLRRELTVLARGDERIDWDARRVDRVPAALQDDCAIGVLAWRPEPGGAS